MHIPHVLFIVQTRNKRYHSHGCVQYFWFLTAILTNIRYRKQRHFLCLRVFGSYLDCFPREIIGTGKVLCPLFCAVICYSSYTSIRSFQLRANILKLSADYVRLLAREQRDTADGPYRSVGTNYGKQFTSLSMFHASMVGGGADVLRSSEHFLRQDNVSFPRDKTFFLDPLLVYIDWEWLS